jgi:hypothetical protein
MKLPVIIAGALALGLAGCAPANLYKPAPGQKMPIAASTYQGFKDYQALIGSTHSGVFAVSEDGRFYEAYWCDDIRCMDDSSVAHKAIVECGKYGSKCYVFANRNTIQVDYEVVP